MASTSSDGEAAAGMRRVRRHLATSRREMRRAVERFAGIDPLSGHRREAVRLMREVRDAADRAVNELGGDDA